MTYIHYIGIDISKNFFDVVYADTPKQSTQFSNNKAGVHSFWKQHKSRLSEGFVVMEATGGYEALLLEYLTGKSVATHRATPLQAKHYLRSLRLHGKTDRLDAAGLARYAKERSGELLIYKKPDVNQRLLQSLLSRRADILAMKIAEQQRSKHPNYETLKDSVSRILSVLKQELKDIEGQIEQLVLRTPKLQKCLEIMTSEKGIGKTVAFTMLTEMPELGTLTRRQAAALAGCAPYPKDSGKSMGYRRTNPGRKNVKRALFLAAMSARNHNPKLREFYEKLVQNGKKPMVAIIAVARKLITIINAKIRDNLYQNIETSW